MNDIQRLLVILYSIRFYAKDLHYTARGSDFWSDHLFADEIFDGIDDFIDQINENLYLGYEHPAPHSKDVVALIYDALPPVSTDMTQGWKNLYALIVEGLARISAIKDEFDDAALNALLDSIADSLQKKKGLVWRRKLSI